MIKRDEILDYLEEYLKVNDYSDYCVNGLQVEGSQNIKRIITGVSVSQKLFQKALEHNADMIITHHGLFWKSLTTPFALVGTMKNRLKTLLSNDINLAAYHLPLDAHPVIGNNALLLNQMGLQITAPFDVGYLSRLESAVQPYTLKNTLDTCLPMPSTLFGNTNKKIKILAIVSGGGAGMLENAAIAGADALVTGEISEPSVRTAEELDICLFQAGHYNTERPGVMALADHLSDHFKIPVLFVDVPNPV